MDNETVEQKLIISSFVDDLLTISYRPEFPMAYRLLYKLSAELMYIINENIGATLRNYALEVLGDISRALARDIRDVKTHPLLWKKVVHR
jgi:hypothetical protein